jgi:hypothetical protein
MPPTCKTVFRLAACSRSASKTSYYLNTKTAATATSIANKNDQQTLTITAECAYL